MIDHDHRHLLCRSDAVGGRARWTVLAVMVVAAIGFFAWSGIVQENIKTMGVTGVVPVLFAALCVSAFVIFLMGLASFTSDQEKVMVVLIVAGPLVWAGISWSMLAWEGSNARMAQAEHAKTAQEHAAAETLKDMCAKLQGTSETSLVALCHKAP